MPTPGDIRVERARSAIGRGIRYGLGRGGLHPLDPLPCRPSMRRVPGRPLPVRALWLDCSGFAAWVLGRSRKPSRTWPWWLSTDALWLDARGRCAIVASVQRDAVQPGDLAVYPDAGGKQGHVALVVDPARHIVIDCSSSHDGVTEHEASYFWRRADTVFCRPVGGSMNDIALQAAGIAALSVAVVKPLVGPRLERRLGRARWNALTRAGSGLIGCIYGAAVGGLSGAGWGAVGGLCATTLVAAAVSLGRTETAS